MAKRKPPSTTEETPSSARPENYTVLARRYRPQQFQDIIGQEHVAQALVNALQSNRVAHAYLFTGARGVGKTSTARILAKALNCVQGPTPTPCDRCEVCLSIASGEDVDVLEIDGASNRGIDEIRELRQNVQYRPSRARFKIYIIDEVHMLTREAFNALLKTLEEPPPHVKFIFATTEVQKIPLTILSRCQRFDFAGIGTARIKEHLRQVVADEKLQADDEALELIARRAAGSMRDAQSLLDQLLAFGEERLTAEHVYRLLGTAHVDQVVALAKAILERNPKEALELLGRSLDEGLQLGELLDQLIDYWRDLMVVGCAGADYGDISVPPRHRDTLIQQVNTISLDSILALSQLAQWMNPAEGRSKMEDRRPKMEDRGTKIEDRRSKIEDRGSKIEDRGQMIESQQNSEPAALDNGVPIGDQPAKFEPRSSPLSEPPSPVTPRELTEASLARIWPDVLAQLGPMLAGNLGKAESVAISGPKTLVLRFPSRYNHERDYCQLSTSIARTQEAILKVTGQAWNIRVESASGGSIAVPMEIAESNNLPSSYRRQRADASQEPLVKRAMDVLAAQIVHVDDGFGATRLETVERAETANSEEI